MHKITFFIKYKKIIVIFFDKIKIKTTFDSIKLLEN